MSYHYIIKRCEKVMGKLEAEDLDEAFVKMVQVIEETEGRYFKYKIYKANEVMEKDLYIKREKI